VTDTDHSAAPLVRLGRPFPSRWTSTCALCWGRIEADDRIAAVLDDDMEPDGYACTYCMWNGERGRNPWAVGPDKRAEATDRLLSVLSETPSLSLERLSGVVGVLPEQLWSVMGPLLRDGRLSYIPGSGSRPNTYTVHAGCAIHTRCPIPRTKHTGARP
jgi:hypothetical protein